MQILEDRMLIRRFKSGDSVALRRIYEKHKDNLLKLAVVLTNDVNTAEDSVHDVFLNFARSIGRINPRGNLRAYLATALVNRIRNVWRDAGRKRTVQLDEAEHEAPGESQPQRWAILSEQLQMLSAAMAELPEEQRQAVALRIEGAMSFRQIAEIQSTSANTVKGRYRYGINKLRSILNGKVI